MPVLVGQSAPDFCAAAVLEDGSITSSFQLSHELKDKYGVVFFYPLNFTFVCPTELIELNKCNPEFKKRNVKVIGISIDSEYSHLAWRNTPIEKGGIGNVSYALVADINHSICRSYGVEHPQAGVALRGVFLIDKQGVVRAQIVNDLPIGRNIDEIIRLVDALQFHEQQGEVCPAGWNKGSVGIKASPEGIASYLQSNYSEL